MRSYVITIYENPASVTAADRCIASGEKFGVEIEKFYAFTPKSHPRAIAQSQSIPTEHFKEIWSRTDNALAAFLSHYTLWVTCTDLDEEIQIFEHDAVITAPLPGTIDYKGCISLGAPSYGKFKTPPGIGVNRLVSKQYFPGAHAYRLRPDRAKELIERSKIDAGPTDVFLHNRRFNFLQEYYPWPVEARDDFTTIQTEKGCLAKHRNGPGYQIL